MIIEKFLSSTIRNFAENIYYGQHNHFIPKQFKLLKRQ